MYTKNEIRAMAKAYRKSLDKRFKTNADAKIAQIVLNNSQYKSAENVLVYVALENEIDTYIIMDTALKSGKRVAVPRCISDGKMEFYAIASLDDLECGSYGILEPKRGAKPIAFSANSVMIIPALATDINGYRVGYGKGYYDRYIATHNCFRICLCYSETVFDNIFPNEFDCKADCIITENGTICVTP